MRALAAIVALVACSCRLHAHGQRAQRDHLPRALLSSLGVTDHSPIHRLLACGRTLGPSKCLSALSAWRAEKAVDVFEEGGEEFNVTADVVRFPWEQYTNVSDEELSAQLCDGAERLLKYRSLTLTVPGYSLELESRGNGALNLDIVKNDVTTESSSGRGSMKKLEKKFYNILPLLMIPGLIMSAILPFVLPALKLMTMGVVMLNNMALSGAVFTLLRNNAFGDKYEHKVIYVNEGYKNEKRSPAYYKEEEIPIDSVEYGASKVHGIIDGQIPGDEYVEEYPTNDDWINQYYGNGGTEHQRRTEKVKSNQRNSDQ